MRKKVWNWGNQNWLKLPTFSYSVKESIATLMKYSAHTVYLVSYPDVQQQTDRSNCGLLHWHLYIPLVKTMTLQEWHIVETLSIPILFMCLEKENITSFQSGQSLYSLASAIPSIGAGGEGAAAPRRIWVNWSTRTDRANNGCVTVCYSLASQTHNHSADRLIWVYMPRTLYWKRSALWLGEKNLENAVKHVAKQGN